jgi:hypothetical protein
MIDDMLYNTVQKKGDLLKGFNDYSRFKFKQAEERAAQVGVAVERGAYQAPKFDLRDMEVNRMKANKSKKSEKYNDMMS